MKKIYRLLSQYHFIMARWLSKESNKCYEYADFWYSKYKRS